MIDDVHEPLAQYLADFKAAHVKNTSDFFEDLVRQSGVDAAANAKTVQQLRQLEQQADKASSANKWWRVLRGVVIAATLFALGYIFTYHSWPWFGLPIAIFAAALYKLNQVIADTRGQLKKLKQACDAKRNEAWKQMTALNQLYDWDIVAKLVQKTVPRIAFDPYFSNGRIEELRNSFGWSGDLGNGHSILFSHSGVLNGNPFILANTLKHWMGRKTYHGSRQISWTERVQGTDGKWRTETRHETLHASVEKPFPEYNNQTFIIYGNEAAPDLLFSRSPSKLSQLEDGFFDKMRKNHAIKKLENKSRDIRQGKAFAPMSNREFDALFDATDRNHEVQFRLLFTPLAQQEMLKLLKDSQVGYGDDFVFKKMQMINVVEPAHMCHTDIGAEPAKFYAYELAHARAFFNNYHNDFFRSFYFGIAPLLTIPLYQQHRSHADIYKDTYTSKSCFWEHEAIANYHGEAEFKHPDCVTRSILKTSAKIEADGSQSVRVTANGYSSIEKVTHVSVWGGDGRSHQVSVDWDEYHDVQRVSNMLVKEKVPDSEDGHDTASDSNRNNDNDEATVRKVFERRGIKYDSALLRRSIVSAVLPS